MGISLYSKKIWYKVINKNLEHYNHIGELEEKDLEHSFQNIKLRFPETARYLWFKSEDVIKLKKENLNEKKRV